MVENIDLLYSGYFYLQGKKFSNKNLMFLEVSLLGNFLVPSSWSILCPNFFYHVCLSLNLSESLFLVGHKVGSLFVHSYKYPIIVFHNMYKFFIPPLTAFSNTFMRLIILLVPSCSGEVRDRRAEMQLMFVY